jgi:hypothetical protein
MPRYSPHRDAANAMHRSVQRVRGIADTGELYSEEEWNERFELLFRPIQQQQQLDEVGQQVEREENAEEGDDVMAQWVLTARHQQQQPSSADSKQAKFVKSLENWRYVVEHERCEGMTLNTEQSLALDNFVDPSKGIVTLEGTAGSGKTACVLAAIIAHDVVGCRVLVVTLGGRMSTSHNERLGLTAHYQRQHAAMRDKAGRLIRNARVLAMTIHMATALAKNNKTFAEFLKRVNMIVVDEAQNNDLKLLKMVKDLAERSECLQKLAFVGDPKQIPPIGVGHPYLDIIRWTSSRRNGPDSHVALVVNNRILADGGGAGDTFLTENAALMVDPRETSSPSNALTAFPFSLDSASSGVSKLQTMFVGKLKHGDADSSVQIHTVDSPSDIGKCILDIYHKEAHRYKEINIITGERFAAYTINQSVGLVIKNEIAFQSADFYDRTTSAVQQLLDKPYITPGTKVRFMSNCRRALVVLRREGAKKLRAWRKEHSKEHAALLVALQWGSVMDSDGAAAEGDEMKPLESVGEILARKFGWEEGRDYIISDSVSNGELDWIESIEDIGEHGMDLGQLVKLKMSGKYVVIGNAHVSEHEIQPGYATTIDSQMGSECSVCIVVLYQKSYEWLDRNRLLVALTRARKKLHIISYKWEIDGHTFKNKLVAREINAGRDAFWLNNGSAPAMPAKVSMGTMSLLQLIYTNQTRVRASDTAYYLAHNIVPRDRADDAAAASGKKRGRDEAQQEESVKVAKTDRITAPSQAKQVLSSLASASNPLDLLLGVKRDEPSADVSHASEPEPSEHAPEQGGHKRGIKDFLHAVRTLDGEEDEQED